MNSNNHDSNSGEQSSSYYGGIEGGGTHSKIIICDATGRIVANVAGPATNHWIIGIPECAERIAGMVAEAKRQAHLAAERPLRSIGLCLSGCEQEASNRQLEHEIRERFASVAEHYVVCSDTLGSLLTMSPDGGVVLIAGTGSNALLRNPDGRTFGCGGWGHMLGDEGSAWWIAHRAIKTVLDHLDGLRVCSWDVQPVWRVIQAHFAVEKPLDLLEHCYANFNKSMYAKLCAKLAREAAAGEPLCAEIFRSAGEVLARSLRALLPRVSDELIERSDGALNVVCVGSVWNSWTLLSDGFVGAISRGDERTDERSYDLRLVRLTQHMALGAVYMGIDAIGGEVPRDYAKNYDVFHVIKRSPDEI